MKILFLSTRQDKPSFRFRVEQMLPFFEQAGHDCTVEFLPRALPARYRLYRRLKQYDVLFLQKRLLGRSELFLVRQAVRRLVYDLDDAVMFNARGETDRRRQRRFQNMVRAADLTLCGNDYLAHLAAEQGGRAITIPTAIDTARFRPALRPQSDPGDLLTVGWTGSRSTTRYLNDLLPLLADFAGRIRLKVLSDSIDDLDLQSLGAVPFEFTRWSPETEIRETATFDVGLMPLPENRWTRGKCGFKALQYLSLGIPAVCSPVGVNCEIITHGENGILAATPAEWSDALSLLINDATLRKRLTKAGRQRVETTYALNILGPRTVAAVENHCESSPLRCPA